MRIRNVFEAFFVCAMILQLMTYISAYGPGLKTGLDFRDLALKRVWKMTFSGLK